MPLNRLLPVVFTLVLAACSTTLPTSPTPGSSHQEPVLSAIPTATVTDPTTRPSVGQSPSAEPTDGGSGPSDLVLADANVITLDDGQPRAEALIVRGEQILDVGSNDEMLAAAGPSARVVNLAGMTVVPGFIDAHQHRIVNGPGVLGLPAETIIDAAIGQGLTTIAELYVDESRLAELVALDDAGSLRLHVDAYLPVNENSEAGTPFSPYYDTFLPGQTLSPNVRVAGLKFFIDFDNANLLLWRQSDLDDFVLARHSDGWQLALKTVAANSLDMILTALRRAAESDATVLESRARLEHNLIATPDQIGEIAALGVVPAINLNMPGQGVDDPGIDDLISRQPAGSYVPWRSMFEAGISAAGISGFPSYYVDEPTGAPFGSPIHMIYQAVTRVGNLGQRSPDELLDQAITADEALRSLTINAARAAFSDDSKGSIEPGKLADLVVLSNDPLAVDAEEINDIEVLLTVIAGRVEHCDLGPVCDLVGGPPTTGEPTEAPPTPGDETVNLAHSATVSATSELPDLPATNVIDGTGAHWNAAEVSPQSIDISLGQPSTVEEIRLHVAQDPAGPSVHQLWIGQTNADVRLVHRFEGVTFNGDVLIYRPDEPLPDVELVRVVTTQLGNLFPAWQEIEVLGP